MAAPKLSNQQRAQLLQWVAEGLQADEINKRAAQSEQPFSVSRATITHYRKSRGVAMEEIKQTQENDALTTGLSIKAERVKILQQLAERLIADLLGDSLWVTDVKGVNGELVHVEKFNAPESAELRQVLEQIATEAGDRATTPLVPSEIRVRFVKPDGQP